MASWSYETPLQLRIITCYVGFKSFGFHLELEVFGFHLELEVFGFQLELELGSFLELLELSLGRSCHMLSRVLCAHVHRCQVLDSLSTVGL